MKKVTEETDLLKVRGYYFDHEDDYYCLFSGLGETKWSAFRGGREGIGVEDSFEYTTKQTTSCIGLTFRLGPLLLPWEFLV